MNSIAVLQKQRVTGSICSERDCIGFKTVHIPIHHFSVFWQTIIFVVAKRITLLPSENFQRYRKPV